VEGGVAAVTIAVILLFAILGIFAAVSMLRGMR
jgi:hypothetical protein